MKNVFKSCMAIISLSFSLASFAAAPGDHKKSAEVFNPQALLEDFRNQYLAAVQNDPAHREAYRKNPAAYHKDLRAQLEIYAHGLIAHNPAIAAFFALPIARGTAATSASTAAAGSGADSKSAAAAQQTAQQTQGSNAGSAAAVDNRSAAGAGAQTASMQQIARQADAKSAAAGAGESATVNRKQAAEMQLVKQSHYKGASIHVSSDNMHVIVINADGVLTLYHKLTNKAMYTVKDVNSSFAGFCRDNTMIYYELKNGTVALYNFGAKLYYNFPGSMPSISPDQNWLTANGEDIVEKNKVSLKTMVSLSTMTPYTFYGNMGWFSANSKRYFLINNAQEEVTAIDLVESNNDAQEPELNSFGIPFKDASKIQVRADGQAIVIDDNVLYSCEHKTFVPFKGQTVKICKNGVIIAERKDAFTLINKFVGMEISGTFMDITYDGSRMLLARGNKVFQRSVLSGAEELIGECEFPWAEYTFDGLTAYIKSYYGDTQLISLVSKQPLFKLKDITSVQFSSDYSLMAVESHDVVFIYNPKTGQLLGKAQGAFLSFKNNILITAGAWVGKDRNYYAYDYRDYLCKDMVVYQGK